MRKRWLALSALALVVGGVLFFNASFWGRPEGTLTLLSHRGVHHPTHSFIENTLPSIAAAFRTSADIIEIDIHPARDGAFAVFNDWTLVPRGWRGGVATDRIEPIGPLAAERRTQ